MSDFGIFSEHEEIATYSAVETSADVDGALDAAKLARAIRSDEERLVARAERNAAGATRKARRA